MATHPRLLRACREVLQKLAEDVRVAEAATATLFHHDLHMRNMFVSNSDPSIITYLIDWQSSSIDPAFEYADWLPDFVSAGSAGERAQEQVRRVERLREQEDGEVEEENEEEEEAEEAEEVLNEEGNEGRVKGAKDGEEAPTEEMTYEEENQREKEKECSRSNKC